MAVQMFRKSPVFGRAFLCVDEFHELSFDRCKDGAKVMPAFQNCAAFADQCPHALAVAQCWSLFNAIFRPLGGTPERTEHGGIAAKVDGIIAPITRCDHPPIKIEYLG